jgi:hypothetical protein
VDTGVASSIKAAASHLEQLGSLVEEVCCSLSKNNKYFFVFVYSRSLKKNPDFLIFYCISGFAAVILSWLTCILHISIIRSFF